MDLHVEQENDDVRDEVIVNSPTVDETGDINNETFCRTQVDEALGEKIIDHKEKYLTLQTNGQEIIHRVTILRHRRSRSQFIF